MGSDSRKHEITLALRTAENERLRDAFEELERLVDHETGAPRTAEERAMEAGYRAALWVMREAIDDGPPSR